MLHNSHGGLVSGPWELCSPGLCPGVSVQGALHTQSLAPLPSPSCGVELCLLSDTGHQKCWSRENRCKVTAQGPLPRCSGYLWA